MDQDEAESFATLIGQLRGFANAENDKLAPAFFATEVTLPAATEAGSSGRGLSDGRRALWARGG